MVKFTTSSIKNPCPICGRTKDSDCRISQDEGLVMCHTEVNHREPKDELNGYIYLGTDESNLWGRWRAKSEGDFIKERPVGREIRYPFLNAQGKVAVEEVRVYRTDGGKDSWMSPAGVDTATLVPYRYTEALQALQDGAPHCFIVEGPPKADSLWSIGFPSVAFANGFKASRDSNWFDGFEDRLVIVPDQDKPGLEKANRVAVAYPMAGSFRPWANSARWEKEWLADKGGRDVRDWIEGLQRQGKEDGEIQGMILAGLTGMAKQVVSKPAATPVTQAAKTSDDGYSALIEKLTKIFTESESPSRQQWDLGALARSTKMSIGFLTQLYNNFRSEKDEIVPKSFSEFRAEGNEEREWLIAGFLPMATTAILHSDAGTGKTLLLYDMCKAVVTGSPWNGMPTKQGKVLIVQTDEPSSETRQRLEISGFFDAANDNGAILTKWGFSQILKLRRYIEENHPALVVIDSLTTVNRHSNVEEKDSAFAHGLLDLRDIADDYGCAIVVLHHSNRKGGLRGTGAIDAGVSEIWHLRRGKPTEGHLGQLHRILEIGKSRAGCSGSYQLELDPEDYGWNYQGEVGSAPAGHEPSSSPAPLLEFFNRNQNIWFHPEELATRNGFSNGNTEAVRKQCQRLSRKGLIKEESRLKDTPSGAKRYKVYQAAGQKKLTDNSANNNVRQVRPAEESLPSNDLSCDNNLPDADIRDTQSLFTENSSLEKQQDSLEINSVRQVGETTEPLYSNKKLPDNLSDNLSDNLTDSPSGEDPTPGPAAAGQVPVNRVKIQVGSLVNVLNSSKRILTSGLMRVERLKPDNKADVRGDTWHDKQPSEEVDLNDLKPI